ncbi:MAG: hypothetical protein KIH65_001690 [Candidatus Uhrbacteria bacterium]|nr:hypothetical protein [Candidatus Uhrbacteria bacterium]
MPMPNDQTDPYLVEGSDRSVKDASRARRDFSYTVLLSPKGDLYQQARTAIIAKLGHGDFVIKKILLMGSAPGTRPR